MIFSNTAVRSLSSLLVVAMTARTPSGVGGATTTNRKLSKNSLSSTAPPTTKCPIDPTALLFYSVAINNTIGSPHIVQRFPAATPAGSEKICPDGVVCIGDTYTEFNTLYADKDLTQPVATLASTAKLVYIQANNGMQTNVVTGSIFFVGKNTYLNYGGSFFIKDEVEPTYGMDFSVFGGTGECAGIGGQISFRFDAGENTGFIDITPL